jgi:hypothetical protein
MSVVSFQSLPILIGGYDTEGHLVLIDGQLHSVPSAERSCRKCRQNDARPQGCGETHPDIPHEAAASAPTHN